MSDVRKIAENSKDDNFEKFPDGRNKFKKGHKIGRIKKRGYTLLDLTKVAMEYDKTHDATILKHYIERLQKNDKLLDKFIDRYVPLKQELEIKVPDTIKIKTFIQAGEEPVIKPEEQEKEEEETETTL